MQVVWLNDQQPLLVMFLADGAGSVSQGGEGATLAVNEAMAFMVQKVQDGELGLNDVLATNMVLTIRQRLFAEAEAKELAVRDFACTFLGLISSANGTLIMQIGDSGVVVDFGHGLQLPLTPMVGEYANMTHFITDEDAVSRLETFTSTERVHKVAAFTGKGYQLPQYYRWRGSQNSQRRYNFRNILSAAQYESDLNSERTLAGLAVARAKGRVGGRRPKFTDEQWREMGERMATGESRQSVSKTYGVGLSTLYKKFPAS